MNFSKPLNLALTTILIFIFSNSLFGQKLEPKERLTEPDHTITSKIMGKDYQLYISFPKSYTTKDTIMYPVLYVLDGKGSFESFKSVHRYLTFGNTLGIGFEDVIIVGIGCGLDLPSLLINRTYDYTPSLDSLTDRRIEKQFGLPKGSVKSGGAAKFLDCIKTEIIPFVDENYKTNTDRGISGHSVGGLFTAYCFLNSDGFFTRFGINSPSFLWNEEKLLNQAVLQYTKNKTWDIPPTKVFISVGEMERPGMVAATEKFSSYIESNDYENIDLNRQIFENESHFSVMPAMLSRTISVLYGTK